MDQSFQVFSPCLHQVILSFLIHLLFYHCGVFVCGGGYKQVNTKSTLGDTYREGNCTRHNTLDMAPAGTPRSLSPHGTLIIFTHLLIFLSSNTAAQSVGNGSEIDLQALLSLKNSLNDPTGVLRSWSTTILFCRWTGVACGMARPYRVVSLNLSSANLQGELSPWIANLTSLEQVDLSDNSFVGVIPEELGTLQHLQSLVLDRNYLDGIIPKALGTIRSLRNVDLADNSLVGTIPDFHKMSALQFLDLSYNNLYGSIPSSLGNVSSLTDIWLGMNMLSGAIPETLGQIPNLNMLDLSYNRLSGYVPATLYNVSSLVLFRLGSNNFIGQIPSEIGILLPNLQTLVMGGNKFRGSMPHSLTNMSKLQVLDLSSNLLTGVVPSLGSLANLSQLLLGRNTLEADHWVFLTSLTNCTQLLRLSVDGNILNGSLPKAVGNLSTKLERLNFGRNQISGSIPAEIGNLVNLTLLDMGQNMLSGKIPLTVWNLSKLVVLKLSMNRLSGQIPSTVGNLSQLSQLYLDDNVLSGNIPENIGQCQRLLMLNLSVNHLDGSIPRELFNISSLSLGLDLSNNNLMGPIPPEVGNLIALGFLNVSNNRLSGDLPSGLGQCVQLLSLQMESNMLSGIIPFSFSALKAIQHIDLSENNLTGYVPSFFAHFRSLNYINISYNKFEGEIPGAGIFGNSTAVSLQGNPGLCGGAAIFGLPICNTTPPRQRKSKAHQLLIIIVPLVTIILFMFLYVLITVIKKGTKTKSQPSENFQETMKRVSYGDILRATNWFSLVNRISSSHTASVYIGRFKFETDLVAIKTFHLSEQGSRRSFFSECKVLKHTRHRNLMQAITCCSTVDFDNSEFKAIVYEFMANGSLDMWIHPRIHQGGPRRLLSLGQRISIAADVASALDYLHNQLTPPMIHCDLKPSNVLLDYDMTSRVGDFGSAKFLSSSPGTPEGLGGVGGTIGYIAPEYGMGCKISTGGDVYSFGVLLLEMLTAVRPTDTLCGNALSLHKYVDQAFREWISEVLDPHMPSEEDEAAASLRLQNSIIPLVSIGLMCSMESPKDRPGMHDVCAKIVAIKEAFVETL